MTETVKTFKAPKYEEITKRTVELPFSDLVAAGAYFSSVSGLITYPFRVVRAKMIFTADANNWIAHGWYTSRNAGVSGTGPPSGTNLFGRELPTSQFRGKACIRHIECNVEVREGNQFIKFYTHNTGPYAYRTNGTLTIEEI